MCVFVRLSGRGVGILRRTRTSSKENISHLHYLHLQIAFSLAWKLILPQPHPDGGPKFPLRRFGMALQIGWWVGTGLAAQPVVRRIIVPGMKGFLFC